MKIKSLVLTSIFAILIAQVPAFSTDLGKVAVIDVQKVVSSSKQVKALKKEKASRDKELKSFEKKCQAEIKKESDLDKKKALSEKYKKELNDKRKFYSNDYAIKVKLINKDINDTIAKKQRFFQAITA